MLNSFEKGDALSSVFFGQLACGIFLSPLVLRETVFTPPVLLSVFLLGAVQVGLAYIFFTTGTKYTDPVTASIINALEPILNPILVAVFYGEMLGRLSLVGAVIVICGILYYNLLTCASPCPRPRGTERNRSVLHATLTLPTERYQHHVLHNTSDRQKSQLRRLHHDRAERRRFRRPFYS